MTQQGLKLFPQFNLLDTVDVNVNIIPKTIYDNDCPILEIHKILNIVKLKLVGGLDFKKWCEPERKVQLEEVLAVLKCQDRYTMITNYPSDLTMIEAAAQVINCMDVLQ
ncbi:13278_t:CDS:2 [Funneliformis caledonium]|uniref:13278_t:CDS:1 n=1 Tax=Funneliformis caledonium TaxID=1117310 RepID=A0A9N8V4V5_9GLOM|nr:13278_t:CDS:2 [Funneliformis caledonium]